MLLFILCQDLLHQKEYFLTIRKGFPHIRFFQFFIGRIADVYSIWCQAETRLRQLLKMMVHFFTHFAEQHQVVGLGRLDLTECQKPLQYFLSVLLRMVDFMCVVEGVNSVVYIFVSFGCYNLLYTFKNKHGARKYS